MFALVMKANVFSIAYLCFIINYLTVTRNRMRTLMKMNTYVCFSLGLQYILVVLNLTSLTSPTKFPEAFIDYPKRNLDANKLPTMPIPMFFRFEKFRNDLSIGYLVGIGIDHQQTDNLVFDFIIMIMCSMYILIYSNPILSTNMKKVFWQFPMRDIAS